ncbi:uncharacterized protein DNG_07159 [Cephalotrichum gorgonifer]|uniref:AB hydrolase-1 domain-containing protein n=1 Tax=Cephalotrichum gorgonifer TaxID=2041049 RepID=A0AAE8N2U0_9PEZI|nr:uncharacterized protein DNG_07159 [Cephalotrichum gorgonifer]
MPTISSPVDSTSLFYRDYTPSPLATSYRPSPEAACAVQPLTLVFLHGWPMSSRMYEHLALPLCETHRFRVVAPDRRGFGRSEWRAGEGFGWDVLVGDLVGVLEGAGVGEFVFVASSMGCTESLLAYQGSEFVRERCKGLIWLGPIMPYPLQTPTHPLSPSTELWASILDGLRDNRAQFVSEALPGVFAVEAGNEVHPKVLEHYERIVAEADGVAIERTTAVFNRESEEEMRRFAAEEVPVLVVHGGSDQSMPAEGSAVIIKEMVPRVELKIYERAGHGLYLTHTDKLMVDLLEFVGKL